MSDFDQIKGKINVKVHGKSKYSIITAICQSLPVENCD